MVLGKGTALVHDENHAKHSGFMHPEHPQRVKEAWGLLQSSGLAGKCREIEARQATMEEMRSIHTDEYLDELMNGKPEMDSST
jgi:acetoin utilization deacetylase AcuC-like enzyme